MPRNAYLAPFLARTPIASALLLAVSALACTAHQGQTGAAKASPGKGPVALIEEYCRLDFDGARLAGDAPGARRILSLVTWEAEPGWDTVLIVSSYVVSEARQDGKRANVTVEYRVVGRGESEPPAVLAETRDRVQFRLIQRRNHWLIDEGQIPPHVSVPAFIANLESLSREAHDEKRRSALVREIERLRALK